MVGRHRSAAVVRELRGRVNVAQQAADVAVFEAVVLVGDVRRPGAAQRGGGGIAALVGDGTGHRITFVGDGVLTPDLPIAIAVLDNGLHGVHRQGLAAGSGVEGLYGSLRREGGPASIAGVHIRLVGRPGGLQSGGCRRGNIVRVGPVVRISAGAIPVSPSIGLGAGATVVVAASHRTGDREVAAIGGRSGGRSRHHGVSSTGYIAALVGRQREVLFDDGIDVIPLGSVAGTIGVSIGVGARALAVERGRVVRRGSQLTH